LQTIKIKDLGKIITGKTPSTKKPELFGDEYPFITPSDISSYDVYHIQKTVRGLSKKGYFSQKGKLLPAKTVCYVCIGSTVGKICLTKEASFTNQQLNNIIVDRSRHVPEYIYYRLRYETPRIQSIAGGTGSGKAIYNKTAFEEHQLNIHDYPLQQKIASILSAYDDLIENNLRRIKILEEMAQLIYKEWFVNLRFLGHEKVKLVDSEVGKIPKGWKVKELGDVCRIVMGQSPKSQFYNNKGEGLPFHQGVTDFNKIFTKTRRYCTVLNRIAEKGDILFSVRAPVGRINVANTKVVIGRGLCAIRSNTNNQCFILMQLIDKFKEEDSMGGGTIFKSVTRDDVHAIRIIFPVSNLLLSFEELTQPIFIEMENLTSKNENLRSTRDILLSKLISGEIDVSDLDVAIREEESGS